MSKGVQQDQGVPGEAAAQPSSSPLPAAHTPRWAAYAVLAFSACLWGSGFLFGKIALRELSVGHMLLYRFGFGALGLLPFVAWRRERVPRGHVPLFVVAAVAGVPIQYIVQFEGLARTTVAHASLMIGTVPVLLALAAVLFAGERLDVGGWVLLAISTLGALLIAAGARSGNAAAGKNSQNAIASGNRELRALNKTTTAAPAAEKTAKAVGQAPAPEPASLFP